MATVTVSLDGTSKTVTVNVSGVKLTPNGAQAVVSGVPAGAATFEWAQCSTQTSQDAVYSETAASVTTGPPSPDPSRPWVDVLVRDGSGNPIGSWAGRVLTSPSQPPPPPPTGKMLVGLNVSDYGTSSVTEQASVCKVARVDDGSGVGEAQKYVAAGMSLVIDLSGPYNKSGVQAVNASSWAQSKLSFLSQLDISRVLAVEVLNEPYGDWFWGSNAWGAANQSAYRSLIKAFSTALRSKYGAQAPKVLAAVDNYNGWQAWWTSEMASYVDGVVVHPYGGTGSKSSSALGDRNGVTAAHTLTGKPVWVSEVGWPTDTNAGPTGDSLQWTEAEQAQNVTNFCEWARGTGYVAAVLYFQYRDYDPNNWYGITGMDGHHKPSFTALQAQAQK